MRFPLGSGAVAGTSYAVDTAALAARLGFSRVVTNSIDAAADRDFVASCLHACALTMVHLSRLAEDFIVFTAEEFGFFELADSVAMGSSLMPQKKNPDPLELVRGKAGRAIGHLAGWLATMKGLPSGYNKDLQEDKEAVFDAEATTLGSLQAVTAVVQSLTLNPARAELAASGLLLATDVRRLSRVAWYAVQACARGGWWNGASPDRRGPRLFVSDIRRVARIQRAVRRRDDDSDHAPRVGRGAADTAVDEPGCGCGRPRRAARLARGEKRKTARTFHPAGPTRLVV